MRQYRSRVEPWRRVEGIVNRVKDLSPQELSAFSAWFWQFDSDRWDRQIEADASAGRLDHLVDTALEQHRNGESSDL